MPKVIEFEKRCQDRKTIRDDSLRKRKIEALRTIFQCSRCLLKCAKCGTQVESEMENASSQASPYTFCNNCYDEYLEFRERFRNQELSPKYYWHNDTWYRVWETWIEHQKTLDLYRQSKEFLQLLQEVEELIGK